MPRKLIRNAIDTALETTVAPSFSRVGYEVRKRLFDWQDLDELELRGKVVLVTGANSGLGLAAATEFARLGASVRALVRSDEKGKTTVARIVEATGNNDVEYGVADLADFDSVRTFAEGFRAEHDRLDVLVNNAGALLAERTTNDAGVEMTLAVHVIGPYILTRKLLPLLADSAPARVITVTSGGMYAEELDVAKLQSPKGYRGSIAYARAKRAQVVLTRLWQQKLPTRGVTFHAMHPGWADTPGVESSLPMFHTVTGPFLRTPEQGADTIVWLAAAEEPRQQPGRLWLDRRVRPEHKLPTTRHDTAEEQRLWDEVARLAGESPLLDLPVGIAG